jgi:hypothetical protein
VFGLINGWASCVLAAAIVVSGAAPGRQDGDENVPRKAPASALTFITTFWCGPPLDAFTDARAEEIARAGFTIVGPPCEGGTDEARNIRALDVAARHGLRLWIADARYDERATTRPDWEPALSAATAEYAHHPAFGGYFVADEPSIKQFDDLGVITAKLHATTDRPAYVNLLADYVPEGFAPASYREYVEQFIAKARPRLLSYDYYPFGPDVDRPTFFSNLELMREQALAHDLPFMLIVQAMPHGRYRDPTEAELSWQVFHALAYGARGISYFAYWTPPDDPKQPLHFHDGLVEHGAPTKHYADASRINRVVLAFGRELSGFRSVAVAQAGGDAAPASLVPIDSMRGGPVTVGLFAADDGRRAAVLVNRSYQSRTTTALESGADAGRLQRFDASRDRWVDDAKARWRLPPGGAVLVRWVN